MTKAQEGGEGSVSLPGRSLHSEKIWYPLYRRLGGPQGRSGQAENLTPPGFDPRTIQSVVSRYTDWATRPTSMFRYFLNFRTKATILFTNLFSWQTCLQYHNCKFLIPPVTVNLSCSHFYLFFAWRNGPPVSQGLLNIEASQSHSDTPHSIELLWTSVQPDADTSLHDNTTSKRDIHAPDGIRAWIPSKWVSTDTCLRLRG